MPEISTISVEKTGPSTALGDVSPTGGSGTVVVPQSLVAIGFFDAF